MAKRFVFKLDGVRRVRQAAEKQQRRAVAAQLRRVRGHQERIAKLSNGLALAVAAAQRTRLSGSLVVSEQIQEQRWMLALNRRLRIERAELRSSEQELDQIRRELMRRSTDVKVLEKLRDRRLAEFRRQAARQEQVEQDESATQSFVRQEISSGNWIV